MDEEFNPLFNKLTDSECDMTTEKHVDTHVQTCSSLPAINSDTADWKVSSVKGFMTECLRKQWSDLNKAASDNEMTKMMMMPIVKILKLLKSAQVKY